MNISQRNSFIHPKIFTIILQLRFENCFWKELPRDIFKLLINIISNLYKDEFRYLLKGVIKLHQRGWRAMDVSNKIIRNYYEFILSYLIEILPDFYKFYELKDNEKIILLNHLITNRTCLSGNNDFIIRNMLESIIECTELYYFLVNSPNENYESLRKNTIDKNLENDKNIDLKYISNLFPKLENPYKMFYKILCNRKYVKEEYVCTDIGYRSRDILGYTKGKIEAIKMLERKRSEDNF